MLSVATKTYIIKTKSNNTIKYMTKTVQETTLVEKTTKTWNDEQNSDLKLVEYC